MAAIQNPINEEEGTKRATAIRNAEASLRLEGLEVDEKTRAIFNRYIDGELTLPEMGAAIDDLNEREFGPVRLSRDGRS